MTTSLASSNANRQLLMKLFRAVDSGDWEGMTRCYTADAVYSRPGFPEISGRDAILHFYQRDRPIKHGQHLIASVLVAADQGFCWGTFKGESPRGKALAESFADWYSFQDGKIAARRTFFYRPAI